MTGGMGDYVRNKASDFLSYAPEDKDLQKHCDEAMKCADAIDLHHSKGEVDGANAAWNASHPHLSAAAARAKQLITAIQGFPPADTLNQEMGESHDEHQKYVDNINEGLKNGR